MSPLLGLAACGKLRTMPWPAGSLIAFVVSLSFAAGLNVYATVFALGLAARMHWAMLPQNLHLLEDRWVIAASGALFLLEFVADKIPGVDVVWNVLHTFVRIPLAAVVAFAATAPLEPGQRVLVTCLGAAVAAVAHGSKTAARVAVTASPEPISNAVLSTAEDGVALGLTGLAMHHPMVSGAAVCALSCGAALLCWWAGRRTLRFVRSSLQKIARRFSATAGQPG